MRHILKSFLLPSTGGTSSSKADWNRWSRIRVPEFKGNRSSWHSYLVQFNTIMKMNDCDDNEVKVCKLVEALRGKALDYFESLPKELRLEFESLRSMFEGTSYHAKQTEVHCTGSRRNTCRVW